MATSFYYLQLYKVATSQYWLDLDIVATSFLFPVNLHSGHFTVLAVTLYLYSGHFYSTFFNSTVTTSQYWLELDKVATSFLLPINLRVHSGHFAFSFILART